LERIRNEKRTEWKKLKKGKEQERERERERERPWGGADGLLASSSHSSHLKIPLHEVLLHVIRDHRVDVLPRVRNVRSERVTVNERPLTESKKKLKKQ
jgi:hypothetical protein